MLEGVKLGQSHHHESQGRRTESGDGCAKVAQHGCLGITHLALDRDLRTHIDTAEPPAEDGDGDSGPDKSRGDKHHSEELEEHGSRDVDEPAK